MRIQTSVFVPTLILRGTDKQKPRWSDPPGLLIFNHVQVIRDNAEQRSSGAGF